MSTAAPDAATPAMPSLAVPDVATPAVPDSGEVKDEKQTTRDYPTAIVLKRWQQRLADLKAGFDGIAKIAAEDQEEWQKSGTPEAYEKYLSAAQVIYFKALEMKATSAGIKALLEHE